jgi:hypothetical protein
MDNEAPSRVKLCTAIELPKSALSRTLKQLPMRTSEKMDNELPSRWKPRKEHVDPK